MSETKPSGPGPEDQESAVSLPPDLEQERKELEAECERNIERLTELAQVFGIDNEKFSEQDDKATLMLYQQLDTHPSRQISFQWDYFIYEEDGKERWHEGPRLSMVELAILAKQITENGAITWCSQAGNHLGEVRYPFFNQEEAGAGRHLQTEINHEVLQVWPEKMDVLELEGEQDDSVIADILQRIPQSGSLHNAFVSYCRENNLSEDQSRSIFEGKLKPVYSRTKSNETYKKLQQMFGRVQAHLCIITIQRYWYLDELARSGDASFREDPVRHSPDKKYFIVDPNFQFTEEDARRARELNLPWSRIEKEMGEESTEE